MNKIKLRNSEDAASKMKMMMVKLILKARKDGLHIKPNNIGFLNGKAKAWSIEELPKNAKPWTECPKSIIVQIDREIQKRLNERK